MNISCVCVPCAKSAYARSHLQFWVAADQKAMSISWGQPADDQLLEYFNIISGLMLIELTHRSCIKCVRRARMRVCAFLRQRDHRRPRFYWHNLLTRPKKASCKMCVCMWTLVCTHVWLTGLKAFFRVTQKQVNNFTAGRGTKVQFKGLCDNGRRALISDFISPGKIW